MKQNSIEFIFNQLEGKIPETNKLLIETILEHAELLHKLELQRAFLKNDNSISIQDALERFEDYYNETFKTK